MDNRERLRISGVLDVYGFDDTYVALETELGKMLVRGEGLKIGKLSLEHHDLVVTGFVYSLEYDDKRKERVKAYLPPCSDEYYFSGECRKRFE